MSVLILGLLIFLGMHSLRIFANDWRDRLAGTTYPAGTLKGDALTVLIGVVVWAIFAFWLHLWLIGVNPMS